MTVPTSEQSIAAPVGVPRSGCVRANTLGRLPCCADSAAAMFAPMVHGTRLAKKQNRAPMPRMVTTVLATPESPKPRRSASTSPVVLEISSAGRISCMPTVATR